MNEYQKFCVDEAEYHLQRARELLTDGLRNAKKYHDDTKEFYKILAKVLPFMVWIQHNESLHHDPMYGPREADDNGLIMYITKNFNDMESPRHKMLLWNLFNMLLSCSRF